MLIPFHELQQKYNIYPKGIIHVGANYGQEANEYYRNGVDNVIWIEANPKIMEGLVKYLSSYQKFNPFYVINECVSDEDGKEVTFNVANNEGQSSSILDLNYHKIAHSEVYYTEQITLKTKTLNTIFKNFNLSDFSFLNADIQGAELLMLKGATEILPKMKYLFLEVNKKELYTGCPMVEEIDEFVSQYGFERVQTEWCGDFGWGDALYIKK